MRWSFTQIVESSLKRFSIERRLLLVLELKKNLGLVFPIFKENVSFSDLLGEVTPKKGQAHVLNELEVNKARKVKSLMSYFSV